MKLDRRLLAYLRRRRAQAVIIVALGLVAAIMIVLQAQMLSRVVAAVFLAGQGWEAVRSGVFLFLIYAGVRVLSRAASDILAAEVTLSIKSDLRSALLQQLYRLGPAYTGGERSGELQATLLEGIEQLDAYFSQYLPQLALAAFIPLAYLLIVLPIDPLTALVLLLTAPLIPLFMVLIGSAADQITQKQWRTLSRLSAHFLDLLQGLPTLKRFNMSRQQSRVLAQLADEHRLATLQVLRIAFLSALSLELLSTISIAIIAVEIGLRTLYGHMAFEQAFFLLILAPDYYLPLRQLGARFHAGMNGVAAAQRIFAILQIRTPAVTHSSPRAGLSQPPLPADICFRHVSVHYPGRDLPALEHIDFCLRAGEVLALVGPSGAGKSTLLHCLLRFVAPSQGRITVGSMPLEQIDLSAWRQQIAWVPQQPYLLPATIAENIRLARPTADDAAVEAAARQAQAHDFIADLPAGYETVLGERGARLSGGQAQRIALARAFLKDAPLILLDEATAHLDPASEALIQIALRALLAERSAIMIAHRLATVRHADRILVVDQGRIVQEGDHATLQKQHGLYRQLLQAAGRPG